MPALIVVLTVVVLLPGGQGLFLEVWGFGLVVAIGASFLGVGARSSDRSSGPSVGMAGLGPASLADASRGRARGRGA